MNYVQPEEVHGSSLSCTVGATDISPSGFFFNSTHNYASSIDSDSQVESDDDLKPDSRNVKERHSNGELTGCLSGEI